MQCTGSMCMYRCSACQTSPLSLRILFGWREAFLGGVKLFWATRKTFFFGPQMGHFRADEGPPCFYDPGIGIFDAPTFERMYYKILEKSISSFSK